MESTVTSDGEPMGAAGRGVEQNQRAHDDLRAGSYKGGWRRSGSRDGEDRISGRGGLATATAATATTVVLICFTCPVDNRRDSHVTGS